MTTSPGSPVEEVLALHTAGETTVPEDHVDENGHLTIGHYFSAASGAAWDLVRERVTGRDYIGRRGTSLFTVEHRITYLAELRLGERNFAHGALAGRTAKAVHGLALVLDRVRDRGACRMEIVYVHVDMDTRRSVPMPDARHPWAAAAATGLTLRRST